MKKTLNHWLLKYLSPEPDSYNKVNLDKRFLLAGISSLLGACTAPQPPGKDEDNSTKPVEYVPPGENVSVDQNQGIDCTLCAPGVNPPIGGLPGTPPGQQSPPVGTNPAPNPAPSPAPAPAPTPNPAPDLSTQTYQSLGPEAVNIETSDMMGNLTQTMADGVPITVWGFTGLNNSSFNGDTTRLCPGPVIEMFEGQATTITLISTRPHTLHLHGLDVDQANDGVPSTSGYVTRMLPPFLPPPPGINLGEVFSYQLTAPHAGTYMYHCHVDTVLHMEMGMSGTIVVRPRDGRKDILYTNGPAFDREYIWQLHTFDSKWHTNGLPPVSGSGYLRYTPDYFMINGRDGADILSDSASSIVAAAGQQIVIRLVNIGYMPAVVNLGGILFEVLCSDGRPLKSPLPNRVNDWMVAPGERYDVRFVMPQSGQVMASVNYLDIRGLNILGSALSSITTL